MAILRAGKLAATGDLEDLLAQSGETQQFEINLKGITAETLHDSLSEIPNAEITARASGANV